MAVSWRGPMTATRDIAFGRADIEANVASVEVRGRSSMNLIPLAINISGGFD
jgi:hypothetical protein